MIPPQGILVLIALAWVGSTAGWAMPVTMSGGIVRGLAWLGLNLLVFFAWRYADHHFDDAPSDIPMAWLTLPTAFFGGTVLHHLITSLKLIVVHGWLIVGAVVGVITSFLVEEDTSSWVLGWAVFPVATGMRLLTRRILTDHHGP
ncbi:MAG: hypothetical protein OWQ57_04415 [Sulfobacillus sp.]|nr:hypothetical protein [Sulfobacillus sp.]